MAPSPPRLRILSVGGNAVSAFLSWRLQATNACDVTLVWKSGFESVSQYGISMRSGKFGNERFKPLHVVRTPEDAAGRKTPFDYVLLCVKALPDVYDLASVIESVVTPQHTCILVNTTNTLGVESHLGERFQTNVVLSLVSGAELSQLGPSEFEHRGVSSNVWVGPAEKHAEIPAAIQQDMAEALAMTLTTGGVDCTTVPNIRQQQFERMIGPIAFYPLSVLFETPSHSELVEKVGNRQLVSNIIEELLAIAVALECSFPPGFKDRTIQEMLRPIDHQSTMYQDFAARRPMEIEIYLGSPIKLARSVGVPVNSIEALYAIMHNFNIANQNKPQASPVGPAPVGPAPQGPGHPPRISSVGPRTPVGPPNGGPPPPMGRGRTPSMGPPPPARRGPPSVHNFPMRNSNGYAPRGPGQLQRQPSFDQSDLGEEFSHLAFIDDIPEGDVAPGYGMNGAAGDLALRERELMLRQREIQLREQEFNMRRGSRRPPPSQRGGFDDDDDDEEFVDPMNPRGPVPHIDPDNFDMMSVTSRRNRKAPSASQLRKNPEMMGSNGGGRMSGFGFRPPMGRNRASGHMMGDMPGASDPMMDNPMAGYSSNRYGAVDRKQMQDESRAGSLTRERLEELQGAGGIPGMNGAYPTPRRASLSPAEAFHPGRRVSGRPSPPGNGYMGPNGMPMMNGRPSPPGMMRQPVPRHPPGQGNAVAPHQVEQHVGVSKKYPNRPPHNVRSLTGSASASAGSGESAQLDSENSAHSSQSSFAPRQPVGVR